jgi:hypothetical protein
MRITLSVAIICLCLHTVAQVPVRNEPRHHNIFENEYIRILDVHIAPGDTTQFHIHHTPSVFLSFTKTITNSQLMGSPPGRASASVPGRPSYDSLGTARIHRVWNEDSTWFHVMDIELTAGKPRSNELQLKDPALTLSFNRFLANGYNLLLKTGENIRLSSSSVGYLVISEGEASVDLKINNSVQKRFMKAGHYIWIGAGQSFSITAEGNTASFMLLQLK